MGKGLVEIAEVVERCSQIKEQLRKEVFGQDKAIDAVIDSISNSILYADENDHRPKGLFLFAGTPGVGKTHLATKVAEHLGYEYLSLNMSAYSSKDGSKYSLFGIDPGYKGSSEGTIIKFVEDQKGKPCVIILDEIEKAYIEVIMQFLQILEMGVTDNLFVQGVKKSSPNDIQKNHWEWALERNDFVSFKNVYFFFTTNAGRPLYENGKQPDVNLTKDAIIDAIRKDVDPKTKEPYFPDAILSRFQTGTVVMFRHLETTELLQIGKSEIAKNVERIQNKFGLDIIIDPQVPTLLLLKEGGQVDARNFRKIAEQFVRDQITSLSSTLQKDKIKCEKIYIGVDPEEKDVLHNLLFGEDTKQDVIFVCDDTHKLRLFSEMLKSVEGINLKKTSDYDEAIDLIKGEIFSTPLVFAVLPSTKADTGVTMASVNSALQARSMRAFKEFIEDAMETNGKTVLCVIDLENSSEQTKRDILQKGATEIVKFASGAEAPKVIEAKVDEISLSNMAFDFARKGKALKYEIVPAVDEANAFVRFRYFKKIDNIKGGDDEFLTGKDRMPNISFSQVVGAEKIKEEAEDFIAFLKNPKAFTSKGLKAPKGLLFYGPAGTGKTHMAKAIAHEADVPFIATNGGDIKMGSKEKNGAELLKQYFAVARKYAPSILFIDEMETIALNRTGQDPNADTIVNTLLAEMDGFDSHDSNPVIVIGATNAGIDRENHVDGRFLDPAVVRRFTRTFYVDVPLKEHRLDFLDENCELKKEELETAAQMSQGLSFGKLGNAIEIAKRLAIREGRDMNKEDLENAIETIKFGEKRERHDANRERTAYHEAGHACIGCIVGGPHMPDHATIVSRGDFGGYVGTASDEKGMTYSKEYFENRIRVSLAGRCAEVIRYGEEGGLTYGPKQDFENAYSNIVLMVCKLGMDSEIGVTYYNVSTDKELPPVIQERVNVLFKQYYDETMKMLLDNKELFEDIAKTLYDKEALSKKDIKMIMERHNG